MKSEELNEILTMLRNERRRRVLTFLAGCDRPMPKKVITDAIAEKEFGGNYKSKDRTRVYVALHQTHIPKLTDAGLIGTTDRNDMFMITERGGRTVKALSAFEKEYQTYRKGIMKYIPRL